jgi:hypothetical protein
MRLRTVAVCVLCLIAVGCRGGLDIGHTGRLVDLTHELDESTHAWPGNKPFVRERTAWGETTAGYWYASGEFSMSEHAGTHMDAPIHFARWSVPRSWWMFASRLPQTEIIDCRPKISGGGKRCTVLCRQDP